MNNGINRDWNQEIEISFPRFVGHESGNSRARLRQSRAVFSRIFHQNGSNHLVTNSRDWQIIEEQNWNRFDREWLLIIIHDVTFTYEKSSFGRLGAMMKRGEFASDLHAICIGSFLLSASGGFSRLDNRRNWTNSLLFLLFSPRLWVVLRLRSGSDAWQKPSPLATRIVHDWLNRSVLLDRERRAFFGFGAKNFQPLKISTRVGVKEGSRKEEEGSKLAN